MRIVIGGGPRTGKTTLAEIIAREIPSGSKHTDDLIDHLSWSDASARVAMWMHAPGPWVIEGVATARALRKCMKAMTGAPCDKLIWMRRALVPLSAGQARMAKGCETVLKGIMSELRYRGVEIEYR